MISSRRYFHSLQFQLIFWSVLSLLLLAIIAGGYGFWYSYHEVNDFQDDNLKSMAVLLDQTMAAAPDTSDNLVEADIHFNTDDDDGDISVDIVHLNPPASLPMSLDTFAGSDGFDGNGDSNDNGDTHVHAHAAKVKDNHSNKDNLTLDKLASIPQGLSTQRLNDKTWRVYRLDSAEQVIVVRQRTEFRDDLAKSSAIQSSTSLLVGIALLTLLLPFIMWRMLKPVRLLHQEINQRRESDLSSLSTTNLPTEILPLVESLNRLLMLVKRSSERQQRFIADAAHELRSPLTAISLQLQRLQRITQDDSTRAGLDKLAVRLKRNQQLIEQLLTLARAGNISSVKEGNLRPTTPASVAAVTQQAVGLLIPIADHKNIDLTVDLNAALDTTATPSTLAYVDETSLLLVIKNLIQNAIVYTPEQGQVRVILHHFSATAAAFNDNDQTLLASLGQQVIGARRAGNPKELATKLAGKWVFQVMDSGVGIAPNAYVQAFEPFVRLSQSQPMPTDMANQSSLSASPTTINGSVINSDEARSDSAGHKIRDVEGTGLGLSIVKTICEQAGIDVYMSASTLAPVKASLGAGLCVSLVF